MEEGIQNHEKYLTLLDSKNSSYQFQIQITDWSDKPHCDIPELLNRVDSIMLSLLSYIRKEAMSQEKMKFPY